MFMLIFWGVLFYMFLKALFHVSTLFMGFHETDDGEQYWSLLPTIGFLLIWAAIYWADQWSWIDL